MRVARPIFGIRIDIFSRSLHSRRAPIYYNNNNDNNNNMIFKPLYGVVNYRFLSSPGEWGDDERGRRDGGASASGRHVDAPTGRIDRHDLMTDSDCDRSRFST